MINFLNTVFCIHKWKYLSCKEIHHKWEDNRTPYKITINYTRICTKCTKITTISFKNVAPIDINILNNKGDSQ